MGPRIPRAWLVAGKGSRRVSRLVLHGLARLGTTATSGAKNAKERWGIDLYLPNTRTRSRRRGGGGEGGGGAPLAVAWPGLVCDYRLVSHMPAPWGRRASGGEEGEGMHSVCRWVERGGKGGFICCESFVGLLVQRRPSSLSLPTKPSTFSTCKKNGDAPGQWVFSPPTQ